MKRSQALSLLTLALAGLPSGSLAQTPTTPTTTSTGAGNVTVLLSEINGEAYNAMRGDDISQEQCEGGGDATFDLSGMPTESQAKWLWVLMGDNCVDPASRNMSDYECKEVYTKEHNGNPSYDVNIELSKLCADQQGNTDLYFLFVSTVPTSAEVQWYGTAKLPIDTSAPDAPRNVTGGRGETAIPVKWDESDGSPANYWVFWEPQKRGASSEDDDDGGTDDCSTSTKLIPGVNLDPSTKLEGVFNDETEGQVSEYELSSADIGMDADRAVVAVIAEDKAGNRSVLSNTSCVQVVESHGFWDDYQDNGGTVQPGCACSVPSKDGSTWSALPLALALFGLQLRRIRRRRS